MAIYFSKPGIACAAGISLEELMKNVYAGNQDGIKKIQIESGEEFFVARIDDKKITKSKARYNMRIMCIEDMALDQIANDIEKAKSIYGAQRIAVCVGSCDNGTEFSVAGHKEYLQTGQFPKDYSLEIQGADYVASHIAERFGLKASVNTFSTACSSSAAAIIKASELIRAELADAVVVGGIDIASTTTLLGFGSLEAISSEITNPFSKNRHGITLGEAGVFFLLCKEDLYNTGVKLLSYGESADAYHMTSPDPTGQGAQKAIQKALDMAKLKIEDIDYINLHGTGTKSNDSMETKAINAVFGDIKVPVSSTKAITGHTLGAAAALEASICYGLLVDYFDKKLNNVNLPVQVWDGEKDSELPDLNFISKNPVKMEGTVNICMSNSFAFGGANACLILGKN